MVMDKRQQCFGVVPDDEAHRLVGHHGRRLTAMNRILVAAAVGVVLAAAGVSALLSGAQLGALLAIECTGVGSDAILTERCRRPAYWVYAGGGMLAAGLAVVVYTAALKGRRKPDSKSAR
jgi:hypothetical protein